MSEANLKSPDIFQQNLGQITAIGVNTTKGILLKERSREGKLTRRKLQKLPLAELQL